MIQHMLNNSYILLLLYITAINIYQSDSAKILCLYPSPSYSHQQPALALSYALAAKGHQMTILTTNPSKVPLKNVREIDLSSLYKEIEVMQEQGTVSFQKRKGPIELLSELCEMYAFVYNKLIRKQQFVDFIKEVNGTKYDLILYEPLFFSSLLGFSKITGNPPVVGVLSFSPLSFTDDQMGNPIMPSFIPELMSPFTDHMTLKQRLFNLYVTLYLLYVRNSCILPRQEEFLRQIFGDVPYTARELEYNKSLLIASTDWAFTYPKPHQPNTIYVGPLQLQKPKPLPQDIKTWMDEADEGVIYFSLGSKMKGKSVPPYIREMFIKAFKEFPKVRVLWKWEEEDLLGRPPNVLVKKWLPQQSILAHPKVKLFISQGGLQSLAEAVNNKVPILGIPMFGDQDYNIAKVVKEGAGRALEFTNLSHQQIYENIKIILTNPSYKENVERLWRITNDKPMSAMDTAIWWVEYVLRHKGAPHLRPASLDLTWYQLYMIDIAAIFIVIVLIILGSAFFIIQFIIKSYHKKNVKLKIK